MNWISNFVRPKIRALVQKTGSGGTMIDRP